MMDGPGRWKPQDKTVTSVVAACKARVKDRRLKVSYRHQRGHQSSWTGRDDYAMWNGRADALATRVLPMVVPGAGRVRACQTGRRSSGRMRPGTR
jgi:hypothetical protein